MISEARIASRSSIAIDLKLKGKEGEGSYDLSVLKNMEQLLGDLLILRDSEETFPVPETRIIEEKSAERIQAFFNQCEELIKVEFYKIEWAAEQVRNARRGNFSHAKKLPLYLTML